MTTRQEALDRIAALLPEPSPLGGVDMIDADRVRAVLAEVTPESGCTLYRDQALKVLLDVFPQPSGHHTYSAALDRLAGCVRPATIDRDQAAKVLWEAWDGGRCDEDPPGDAEIDRLAACVRPVAGVTLTTEEAALAREAVRLWANGMPTPYPALTALADRLEAAS